MQLDITHKLRFPCQSPLSRKEKKALGVANPVLSNPLGKNLIYRKVQDRKKDEPDYKELKEEVVRESDHTIPLKTGK